MKTKTIPVATFNTQTAARRLQQRLQEAGFEAVIDDQSKLQRFWFISEPLAAAHVEVMESDYLAARDLVSKLNASDTVMSEAVCCPDCGSSNVEYPQITRKFFMPVVQALLMLLRIIPREFYCVDCQYTWPRFKRKEKELDVLGWPRKSKAQDQASAGPRMDP